MAAPALDPVAAPLLELLAVFEGPLKDVRFPDVDRAVLVELADAVRASAEDVERAGAALLAAKAALDDRRDALVRMSQRAIAYARVYAEDDAELRAKLDAIAMPKSRAPARPAAARAAEAPVSSANPVTTVSTVSTEITDAPGNEVVEAPAPKRRGRPPKAKPEATPVMAASEPIVPASEPIVTPEAEAEETLAAE